MKVGGFPYRQRLPHLVVHTRERTVQTKRHRFVRDEVQILAVELERLPFFSTARHQADSFRVTGPNVVGARQSAAHQQAGTRRPNIRIVRRTDGDREIEIAILEHQRPASVPALHDISYALLADLGYEES